jgi:glycosyltransferase involved in cell wall biosynthesis
VLAIVVPCFNEESRFSVLQWQSIVSSFTQCHWIFVDDGSLDNTSMLLDQLTGANVHRLDLPTNNGKGNAIHAGLNFAVTPPAGVFSMSASSPRSVISIRMGRLTNKILQYCFPLQMKN